MGQKTNPIIFRLGGKYNEWYSKYFERNKEEFTRYNYQNIEIQRYLKEFLNKKGLFIQKCKLHYNDNNLYIFVSYFSTKKSNLLLNEGTFNQTIKLNNRRDKKQRSFKRSLISLKLNYFLKDEKLKLSKIKMCRIKRVNLLKKYKQSLNFESFRTHENLIKNGFIEQILETLSLFTSKKFHIFLVFRNLNKGMTFKLSKEEQNFLKKKILFLKRYSKNKFFRESLNIVFTTIKVKNSAEIIAEFLAQQIAFLNRHNHFLVFVKKLLNLFINSKFSKIKGVKIVINGRFNGAPRAKSRLILIGNVSTQTITNFMDYAQTTSYTKNGTFGVKVWIN